MEKFHEKIDDLGVPPILGNLHMGLTWINRVYIVLYSIIYIMLLLSDLTTSNISAEKWNWWLPNRCQYHGIDRDVQL